jgi:hypothetical protein
MIPFPSSGILPIATGVPAMTVVVGTPILLALALAFALCLGVIVAAALSRRASRGHRVTRWPAIVASAGGAVVRRLAAGGVR